MVPTPESLGLTENLTACFRTGRRLFWMFRIGMAIIIVAASSYGLYRLL